MHFANLQSSNVYSLSVVLEA